MIRSEVKRLQQQIFSSFWFLPGVMSLFSLLLLGLSLQADALVAEHWPELLPTFLRLHSSDITSTLLGAIVGALITLIGLVFSLTMIVMTLASSQYGPHTLQNFMEDRLTKVVLGQFIANLVFCLILLRAMDSLEDAGVSITLALVFTLMSIIVLVFYIHHIAQAVQVSDIVWRLAQDLDTVHGNLNDQARRYGCKSADAISSFEALKTQPSQMRLLTAPRTGYIEAISWSDTLGQLEQLDACLEIVVSPGDFVRQGDSLATLHCAVEGPIEEASLHKLCASFGIHTQRTTNQDLRYAVEKLVEVAVRALSPGINEPFLATTCIDFLFAYMYRFTGEDCVFDHLADSQGVCRIEKQSTTLEELLLPAVNSIAHYGGSDTNIMSLLLKKTTALLSATPQKDKQQVVQGMLLSLKQRITEGDFTALEREYLLELC